MSTSAGDMGWGQMSSKVVVCYVELVADGQYRVTLNVKNGR